jgi:hypothetical protein
VFGLERLEKVAEWRTSLIVLSATHYARDQMQEVEMGGDCRAHGREEKCVENCKWRF